MERLRRTLSFRRKKKRHEPESAKPHHWQEDERKVKEGTCSFQVKYLGCVEVFESRGMQVCEDACKTLRSKCKGRYQQAILYVAGDALRVVDEINKNIKKSQRFSFRKKSKGSKIVQAILYISGDSLRVVEDRAGTDTPLVKGDDGQGLIVDQTIEKVSFCAPDRNHEKGFAYICRDGTTRRWMCHSFLALKESGERLSHAVGCAFAVCLEKKQKREKEAVEVSFSDDKTSFSRLGSFRQATLTERLADPQSTKIVEPVVVLKSPDTARAVVDSAPVERPRASAEFFQRHGSVRDNGPLSKLNSTSSPFKRNMSLRLNELPSNLQRQQEESDRSNTGYNGPAMNGQEQPTNGKAPAAGVTLTTDVGLSKAVAEPLDPIAEMCQQLSQGLTSLTSNPSKVTADTPKVSATDRSKDALKGVEPIKQTNPWAVPTVQDNDFWLPSITTASAQPATISAAKPSLHHANTFSGLASTAVPNTFEPSKPVKPETTPGLIAPPPSRPRTTNPSTVSSPPISYQRTNSVTTTLTSPPTSDPTNPFDTAWALRSASTNPFLASTPQAAAQLSKQPPNAITKEFEVRM